MMTVLLALTMVLSIHANNIQVSIPTFTGQNTSQDYIYVQFDLSWANSWRTSAAPNNYDAAWVFVKYKVTGGNWAHATLNTSGHSVTNNNGVVATVDTPTGGKGVFLYRTNDGTGSINWDGVRLRWNYGTDSVADDATATVTVNVFAIEMVYVPQDNFKVGDGFSTGRFYQGDDISKPFEITSSQITFGQSAGNLWASGHWDSPGGSLQSNYPTGYNAFYCMKYEISQGQYADFLNTLTRTQQNLRTGTTVTTDIITYIYVMSSSISELNRQRITCPSSGNGTTNPITFSIDRSDRACNYLSWMDGCAYPSMFRPMRFCMRSTCRTMRF